MSDSTAHRAPDSLAKEKPWVSEDNLKIAGKKADSRGSSTEEQVMCTVSNHVSRCLLSDPTASASGNRSELKAEFG